MEFLIIPLIAIVIGVIYILYHIHKKRVEEFNREEDAKVMRSSQRIKAFLELNSTTHFHSLESHFSIHKFYDNKSNYMRIEPAYLMSADVRARADYFTRYIKRVQENQEQLKTYLHGVKLIYEIEQTIDYEALNMSPSDYSVRENALLRKNTLDPVTDCTFEVHMEYSSPKGQVQLSKNGYFSFRDLFICLESVSRSHLDKKTYSKLAAVERGEVSDSMRYNILSRDNFTCVICGASSKQGVTLHVDHIIPIAKGGKSVPSNLRTLCERCNIGKSDKIEVTRQAPSRTRSAQVVMTANESAADKQKCPQCGASLVKRNGIYGEFYGCSRYPNCRFTKNIDR